jgi:hypothetical protein
VKALRLAPDIEQQGVTIHLATEKLALPSGFETIPRIGSLMAIVGSSVDE